MKMEKTVYYLSKNYLKPQIVISKSSKSFATLDFTSPQENVGNNKELKKKNSLFSSLFKPKKTISSAPTSPENSRSLSLVPNSKRFSFFGHIFNQPIRRENSNTFVERKTQSFENKRKTFKNIFDLLSDSIGREYFRFYSEIESSSENLNFWEDVEKFKNIENVEERKMEGLRIFQLYLTPISEQEIGIPSKICNDFIFNFQWNLLPQNLFLLLRINQMIFQKISLTRSPLKLRLPT
jgi:hypothetical protein